MTMNVALKSKLDRIFVRIPQFYYSGNVTKVVGLSIEGNIPQVPVGAICKIMMDNEKFIEAEVVGLKEDKAILMPIGSTQGIRIGCPIVPLRYQASVKVSQKMLGRVLDGMAQPMDDKGPLPYEIEYPMYQATPSPLKRQLVDQAVSLGVKAIDGLNTCAYGQRVAILAGSGVGKSTLMAMIARHAQMDVNVIGLIGERGREVREFIENDLGEEGLKRSVVIVATSDQPALIRSRAAFMATAIAEYFRDCGNRVMLMLDSLTRFAMASREIGLTIGEPPTVKGYTPSIFAQLPKLLERAGTTEHDGSITGLYTILTEGDDIQDPIADTVRSIVDGHLVLSRKLANNGHYPPIDILNSLSRVMSKAVTPEHMQTMIKMKRLISTYEDMEDFIKMGAYQTGKNVELDWAIKKIPEIKEFLKQNIEEKISLTDSVGRMQQMLMQVKI